MIGSVDTSLLLAAVRWGAVGSLLLTALPIMGSPGPATISLTAASSSFGVRRSVAYLVGIICGTTIVLLAVASGITVAILAVPALRIAIEVIAAVYILWLAYRIATAPPLSAGGGGGQAPSLRGGLLLGVANPKAWVGLAAVFTSARLASNTTLDAASKFAILTVVLVLINIAWLVGGASLAPLLRDPRHARPLNITLAAVLVVATALAVFSGI